MKIVLILLIAFNMYAKERVITLSPSINEIVYALGMGDTVVANTSYCNYPKASLDVKKIGGYNSVSLEKVIASEPTVVIAQNYDKKLLNDLKRLKIKTLVFKTDTLASIKYTIKTLGEYFHKEEKAKELISNIDRGLKSVENIVNDKKILIVISPRKSLSNQIYVTGNNLYFEDIVKRSGNKNAYYSESLVQPVVNTERVIDMNPDIIIVLAPLVEDDKEAQKFIRDAWLNLPTNASKNKNVYLVAKLYAGIPSQRVVHFIDDFKEILENVRDK